MAPRHPQFRIRQSDSLGQVEITANFVPGTDVASVEVQNRIKRVEARLPRAVISRAL